MIAKVISYAGYRAEERPERFVLEGREFTVQKILAQWREEAHDCFKVTSADGSVYLLRYARMKDVWMVEELPV